jgi:transcriptional accessory protein Tex/SPT6
MKLFKRKESIIKSIQEQNALSLDLEKKIHQILIYKSLKIFICLQKKKQQKQTLLENMV